ncbi:VOC family protein [Agromyces sp. H3Y2-19a]|uniref:VOC family protein n=1 Tax=Agromyces chromiiresistens TaxID=3030835 RepID=UPI0023B98D1E|nr:VOC family protein [Agromyces chromiiresistens]MDF0515621.1 VOC family protein [Agromyces chromiiresistens]
MARPVVHWEIGARDAAVLRLFYAELFDWEITGDADYGLVSPTAGGIGGGILQTQGGVPPYVTIYVAVDDLEGALERAAALGGRTVMAPMPIPGVGAFAMFADPEGNAIGLMKEAPAASG